jgi:hypothetical protein
MKAKLIPTLAALCGLTTAAFARDAAGVKPEAFKGRPYSPYADRAYPTGVYFGDTHVHTGLSAFPAR